MAKKLKQPGPKQKGLKKLPKGVRNKMGYAKNGKRRKKQMGGQMDPNMQDPNMMQQQMQRQPMQQAPQQGMQQRMQEDPAMQQKVPGANFIEPDKQVQFGAPPRQQALLGLGRVAGAVRGFRKNKGKGLKARMRGAAAGAVGGGVIGRAAGAIRGARGAKGQGFKERFKAAAKGALQGSGDAIESGITRGKERRAARRAERKASRRARMRRPMGMSRAEEGKRTKQDRIQSRNASKATGDYKKLEAEMLAAKKKGDMATVKTKSRAMKSLKQSGAMDKDTASKAGGTRKASYGMLREQALFGKAKRAQRQAKRQERKAERQEKRAERKEVRAEKREAKGKVNRQERREDRKAARQERRASRKERRAARREMTGPERRADRKAARQERRAGRKERRMERREMRQENRAQRREMRQEQRQERKNIRAGVDSAPAPAPAAAAPAPTPPPRKRLPMAPPMTAMVKNGGRKALKDRRRKKAGGYAIENTKSGKMMAKTLGVTKNRKRK